MSSPYLQAVVGHMECQTRSAALFRARSMQPYPSGERCYLPISSMVTLSISVSFASGIRAIWKLPV